MTAITGCRLCDSKRLHKFLSLGDQPLANALLTREQLGDTEALYPIDLVLCEECTEVQLTEDVAPELLFRDYVYFSSFSETMLDHARDVADRLMRERGLGPGSLVMEIASNDGYLLKHFVAAGVPVLGIDPARNIARIANAAGVRTIPEFFGRALAQQLVADGKRADVMIANNVMAHVPDINGVVAGVKTVLAPGGVFVMETPYVKDMIESLEFDTMYQEHLFCHSLTGLEKLYRRHGLSATHVEWLPIHGGTIQVWVTHAGSEGDRPTVLRMLDDEQSWGVGDRKTYQDFGERVERLRTEVVATLRRLRADGLRIAAYGAAAKGSTLLNYMGIGTDLLEYVVDKNTYKQGMYMPGSHLPIVPPERLSTDRPDYLLILAWNLADEIVRQQATFQQAGGKFIIPVPRVRIS